MYCAKRGDSTLRPARQHPILRVSKGGKTQDPETEFWQQLRALAEAWRVQRDKLPRDHRLV